MKPIPDQAPPLRRKVPRLPAAARKLGIGEFIDVPSIKAAACVVSYGRNQGWVMVRRLTRVWRIE